MSENFEAQGSCLCGAVHIETTTCDPTVGACHCNMCRKWSGGPFFAVDCKTNVQFTGKEYIKVFSSSDWAERGFCSQCGTHLFYRLKQTKQHMIPPGLLNAESKLDFDHQVFIDEKPEYYSFENKTKNMTGKEVFEFFAEN